MTPEPQPSTQAIQQQKPDLVGGTLPLSAPKAGPRQGQGIAGVLAILVLALAFLAASFPARNSDLWFHLATGRLLAQGQFSFGEDPFAYTTQNDYWACHSWLFDVALYVGHTRTGDALLIVLKALVVSALAGFMLRVRRPGSTLLLPALFTALAILAMSPRLLLQPMCVSYFLLGLTFWLLWRKQPQAPGSVGGTTASEANASHSYAGYGALLGVFILWVNVDEWYLLGPLLTALFWVGERIEGQRRTPGWLVLAGLAVCLINPYTYRAFRLPDEFSLVTWRSGLRQDARFQGIFSSPWDADYWHAALRLNAAVLAYYALLLLGLASFLLHPRALRGWRLLVWLPFALLGAWQASLIPFFAVVAAPITALNWQDTLGLRGTTRSAWERLLVHSSHFALAIGLLFCIALSWLGGLAGLDREERHVAWGIQEDPSLRQAAETLDQWHREGLLPVREWTFAVAPQVAHYCAWFCPGQKSFFDHRYPLFPQAAREYETVCQALMPQLTHEPKSEKGREEQHGTDWQQVLRNHHVGVVVFYDREPQRLFAVLNRLANDPEHWTLLRVAGQALIAGWNKARAPGGFDLLSFDADRLAFGSRADKSQREALSAPERGPEQLPQRRDIWARLSHPPAAPAWESAASTMYLHYFQDSEAANRQQKWQLLLPAYAASLAGLSAQPSALTQTALQIFSSQELLFPSDAGLQYLTPVQLGPFFIPLVERSPAVPLLAIRAARRAVAADPEDPNAWLRLGLAYSLLRDFTCEHSGQGALPPLTQLRHVQIVTALEQAVRLNPDLEAARHELAFLYGSSNALDQALEHRQHEARLSRRAGPRPGEPSDDFAYRMELLEKDTAKLVELVQDQEKRFASGSNAFQGDRMAQARLALRLGLSRKALDDILLATPADLLGSTGIRQELELLLSLGRTQEVRTLLNDKGLRASRHGLSQTELPSPLDPENVRLYSMPYQWPAYEWLHVMSGAALGDYTQCREDLLVIRNVKRAELDRLQQQARSFERSVTALLPTLLSASPPFLPAFMALTAVQADEERMSLQTHQRTLRAQQADLSVLEGLLALEQGDAEAALISFAEAQELGDNTPFAGRPIVVEYLGKLKAHLPVSAVRPSRARSAAE